MVAETFVYKRAYGVRAIAFQGESWGLRKAKLWISQSLEDLESKLMDPGINYNGKEYKKEYTHTHTYIYESVKVLVSQSCLRLCDPMDP